MIFKLQDLIPSRENEAKVEGRWVRSMHLPFEGGLFDRLRDSWEIITGRAFAVRWPCHGELELILEEREEALVPYMHSEAHVIRAAHRIGMHKRHVDQTCHDCFQEAFNSYVKVCVKLLRNTDHVGDLKAFGDYMQNIVDSSTNYPWMLFHEHPAYLLGTFLNLDHKSEEFQALIRHSTEARKD